MRALIFDYDGVIVDSETCAAKVAVDLLAERGVEIAFEDISRFVGSTGPEIDEAWASWIAELLGGDAEVAPFDFLLSERLDRVLPALGPRAGVAALIAAARAAGWKIGVGTGQQRERVEAALARLGLRALLDAVVTADDVGRGKPAPDIFLEAARRLDVRPADSVVIEDTVPGCRAALAAGMRVIACPCKLTASSKFPAPARVVASLEDVEIADL